MTQFPVAVNLRGVVISFPVPGFVDFGDPESLPKNFVAKVTDSGVDIFGPGTGLTYSTPLRSFVTPRGDGVGADFAKTIAVADVIPLPS